MTDSWMTPETLRALQSEEGRLVQLGPTIGAADGRRLAQVRALIANADVAAKPDDGVVEPGMKVTVSFGDGSRHTFVLSATAVSHADPVVSPVSPLGTAVNGLRVGDERTYTAPQGTISFKVVSAAPYPVMTPAP